MRNEGRVGGTRVEFVYVNQVWRRPSGNHFTITRIDYVGHFVTTFTVETRRTKKIQSSTLRSSKNCYTLVDYLPGCTCCYTVPKVRYGKVNGELVYRVSCDCLEFDGQSRDLGGALRAWKANMKYIGTSAAVAR